MNSKIVNDFTQGNILKQMLIFSIPFMFSNAMQVLYTLVDMIIVGQVVGSHGLSAVSIASQVTTLMTMFCLGIATGGQVYIAQVIGSERKERLNSIIGTLFSIIGIMAIVLTIIGVLFRSMILDILSTPIECYDMALNYLLVTCIGIVFTFGYNLVSAVLRGMGDSKHPFIFILIASLTNLVLDCLFIIVFHWGVTGAALATIIGQGVSFIVSLIFLYKHKENFGFDFQKKSFKIQKDVLKVISSLGIPFALQNCAVNFSMLFVNKLINGAGVYAAATFGVGVKLDDIINKTTQGITFAVSSMTAQNMGAKQYQRIEKTVYCSWLLSAICYVLFAIIYIQFGREMFAIFTNDVNVLKLSGVFISAIIWNFPAMVLMRGTNGFIQGIGNAKLSLLFALFDGFVLRIFLSYFIGNIMGLGIYGYFLGYGLAAYGTSVPGAIYFFTGLWKKREVLV